MTAAQQKPLPLMTGEEFLAWDGGGLRGKLELVNGEVRAMSPASATHSLIQGNITVAIGMHLRAKGSPCRVVPEAPVIPKFDSQRNIRVPDVAVTCSAISGEVLSNPILIVEIMSPSNDRDTYESMLACATLPSVQEIVLIQSERVELTLYRRDEAGVWQSLEDAIVLTRGNLELASIEASIPIAEIYAGTHLVSN